MTADAAQRSGPLSRTMLWTGVAVVVAAGAGVLALVVGEPTAYCAPHDPVVTPRSAAPGDEVHVEVPRRDDGVDCEPNMPPAARYEVVVRSSRAETGQYGETVGVLDPDDDGYAAGAVRLPDDLPAGEAEVSLRLTGAKTLCEIDPSMSCPKNPFTTIDITG